MNYAVDDDQALVLDGVERLVDDYAGIGDRDVCVVVYSPESRIYAAYLKVILQQRGVDIRVVPMRPFFDLDIEERLAQHLPDPAEFSGNLVVVTIEREGLSHSDVFAKLYDRYGRSRTRIFRIVSAGDEFFAHGLNIKPGDLSARNATLLALLRAEDRVHVTTKAGTDVHIALDHEKYDWISNRGVVRPGSFTILPPGEVASYPADLNGTLVADGAFRCNVVTSIDPRLGATPVTVTIEHSVVTAVDSTANEASAFIDECFAKENARRVGEIGFGTNTGCDRFLSTNSHLNERFPGLHLGFGQPNQPLDVVPYEALVHLDLVTDDADVHFPRAGVTLTMSTFAPTPGITHPSLMRDQDLSGDCCSRGCSPLHPGLYAV